MSSLDRAARLPPLEAYPEHRPPREEAIDRWVAASTGLAVTHVGRLRRASLGRIVPAVTAHAVRLRTLDDAALQRLALELRPALRRHTRFALDTVARSFALIRETADRVLGARHYNVQLIGGYALLESMIAEMQTGEGKTLTATLAAATAALAGRPVHVVTVNDYLARRDAEDMGPLYRFLGLSVGIVVSGQTADDRRAAYACDVTYCTNKELAFDYMRDRLLHGRRRGNLQSLTDRLLTGSHHGTTPVMRGLHFAIIDEADSILVDEARTPLIISGEIDPPVSADMLAQALDLANELAFERDFRCYPDEKRIELTRTGLERAKSAAESLGGRWQIPALREELVRQGVAARNLFHRNHDYLVVDGKVVIIDEYTGRVMPDRQWSQGLHQLIQLKEGCAITGQRITRARMTYQRFFRRYRQLAGMTGTAQEVAHELWCVYRLRVVNIPPNRPLDRKPLRTRILPTLDAKWERIAERIEALTQQGRPVLLGTRSVAASEAASAALARRRLVHATLNAAQDRNEAHIIARAGEQGRITIATNMAGRGTDILLAAGVAELGGLHVILSECHDARRIDRQLAGRCGRQGDPGTYEAILSFEDPLLELIPLGASARKVLQQLPWLGRGVHRYAQRIAERRHSRMRRHLLRLTDTLNDNLAFSGAPE